MHIILITYLATEKHHSPCLHIHPTACVLSTNYRRSSEIHPHTANPEYMPEGAVEQTTLAVANPNAQCL